ncbi:MAG TPA: pirin family protein [Xanthomonadaceae bacterium]|nr:pirin family protein [Xanthomonadaceae bacterium]
MVIERPSRARGHFRNEWLDSRHTFSFGQYHDPAWMGFGALRVINEDRVAPGAGFPTHGHANMEILSYVLDGALAHRDDTGGAGGVLVPGEVQWMSAGHGVRHSEFNGSEEAEVHFLQVWIQPDRVNARPAWASRAFPADDRRGRWVPLASPDGEGASLEIRQDARLLGTLLAPGTTVDRTLAPGRRHWLHVARGRVAVDGPGGARTLAAGDASGFAGEAGTLSVRGAGDVAAGDIADVLLFDLPG